MSYEAGTRLPTVAKFWTPSRAKEHVRATSDTIRDMLSGKTNNYYFVTLDEGSVDIEIPYPTASVSTAVQVFPVNQEAASYARSTNVWGEGLDGSVRIRHEGTPSGSERFGVCIFG